MAPYVPKYVRPEEAAESRARMKRRLILAALSIPAVLMLLAVGYSDQAPDFIRKPIIALDRALGFPFIGLLSTILG